MQVNVIHHSMVSREPPPLAKPKGRKMTEAEKKEITLGTRGEKKGTKRCSVCGQYATHNARTCLMLKENRDRLEAMQQHRQRGRPLGAKNKRNAVQLEGGQEEQERRTGARREVLAKNKYSEWEDDSGSDEMDSEE